MADDIDERLAEKHCPVFPLRRRPSALTRIDGMRMKAAPALDLQLRYFSSLNYRHFNWLAI